MEEGTQAVAVRRCLVTVRRAVSLLAYSNTVWSHSSAYFSARLAVKSEELAIYFGKQFIDIWANYVGPFGE